jgi:hypothetical protein
MANLIKLIAILLVVLPALIAASACKLSVTSKLSDSQSRYNVYTGTINNIGTATAADISLTPSEDLRSVSGLKEKNNRYSLNTAQKKTGIEAGSSYEFSYTIARGKTATWTSTCTDGASSATSAPAAATSAPTAKPAATAAPTKKATAATAAPTKKATAATAAPTTKPAATSAPTTKPAGATSAPSKAATTKPASGAGGRVCPSGTWWKPAPQTTWQWQLTGTIDTSVDVQMYDIDLFDTSAATISTLHSQGRVVICYFSTQYENWRSDASSFTSAVLGANLDDWAGEKYVDIRSSLVRSLLSARLDLAVSKGCDGVEPDNVDSYSASSGFPLTAADQLSFNRYIATESHARGLSVGLKNDLDQSAALQPSFDWALNEQCKQYGECSMLNNFITAGKAVFNAEYSGTGASVCPSMVTSKFSALVKTLSLDASIKAQCCTYQTNGCAKAAYTCVSSSSRKDEISEEQNVYASKALEVKELTTEVPAANSASTSFASIAFVVVAAVAALNL